MAKKPSSSLPEKRKRKRKVRTEVSSSSSSSSELSSSSNSSDSSDTETPRHAPIKQDLKAGNTRQEKKVKTTKAILSESTSPKSSPSTTPPPSMAQKSNKAIQEEFSAFYLRTITQELADDIDKVRSSGDFTDKSLPLLIAALKQGEELFSLEEKRAVVAGEKDLG